MGGFSRIYGLGGQGGFDGTEGIQPMGLQLWGATVVGSGGKRTGSTGPWPSWGASGP